MKKVFFVINGVFRNDQVFFVVSEQRFTKLMCFPLIGSNCTTYVFDKLIDIQEIQIFKLYLKWFVGIFQPFS